jgi:hypothetical protein
MDSMVLGLLQDTNNLMGSLKFLEISGLLRVRHVEFSSKLFLVWQEIRIFEILTAILYGKFNRSRISWNAT